MRPPSLLIRLLEPAVRLVTPERCRVCGRYLGEGEPEALCAGCLAAVEYLGSRVCRCCGGVLRSAAAAGAVCGPCLGKPPPWDQAASVVRYGPEVRHLLSRLKYHADTTVLPALAAIARPVVGRGGWSCDLVLPVPLHRTRLQRRGMNQAVHLARMLFPQQKGTICADLLVRHRATPPQTGLSGVARRRNLRGAFRLAEPDAVTGARVCIVDDVFTTGTTVAECSRIVRRAGAREIKVLTFARVVLAE